MIYVLELEIPEIISYAFEKSPFDVGANTINK